MEIQEVYSSDLLPPAALLLQLPAEVVVDIASWLSLRDIGRLGLTCRTLHTLLAHDSVWHRAAERELDIPHSLALPDHHHTWRDLCARLNSFRRVPGQDDDGSGHTTGLKRFPPYSVGPEHLCGTSKSITVTFWFMMADTREHDLRSLPLLFLRQDREGQSEHVCLALPARSANFMIATHDPFADVMETAHDEMPSSSSGSDSDEGLEAFEARLRRRVIRSSRRREWLCNFETTRALPVLQWTHVAVEIDWSPVDVGSASERGSARFAIRFGTEDVGTDLTTGDRLNPWDYRSRGPCRVSIHADDGDARRKSLIRDLRVYDGQLHQDDIAFLSAIVPPPPEDMAAIEADMMGALASVHHIGVTCDGCNRWPLHGLRYNCAESCNFDLCKACYDAGINPTHLAVSPLHDKDHGFRVLQTCGYSARPYLVPPPASQKNARG